MASEDVLKRFVAMERLRQEHWGILSVDLQRLWDLTCALAAEVRELRKDRERLDWMQRMNSEVFWINAKLCEVTLGLAVGSGEADELRAAIDAAMASRGEDA